MMNYEKNSYLCKSKAVSRPVAGISWEMREESPGSTERSTGESASSWRQLDMGEENDRLDEEQGKGEKVV